MMNREQKLALWFLVSTVIGLAATAITVCLLYLKFGMPKAMAGLGMISTAWLGGFAWFFVRKDKGKVTFDERDAMIKKSANQVGFIAAFVFACLACMTPMVVLGSGASIKVGLLPMIWFGAMLTQAFFYSIAILVGYGRRDKGEES